MLSKKLVLNLLLCCFLSRGLAQNQFAIAEQKKQLPALSGTERVDCLNNISSLYIPRHKIIHNLLPAGEGKDVTQYNIDSAQFYASEAYQMALKLSYAKGAAESLSYQADVADIADNFSKEEQYAREALKWLLVAGDTTTLAEIHFDLGWSLYSLGFIEDAIGHLDSAFSLYQARKDTASMSRVLGILTNVYMDRGDYDKAFEASRDGLLISSKTKDEHMERFHLGSIADVYLLIGDTSNSIAYRQRLLKGSDPELDPAYFSDLYRLKKQFDSADYYMNSRTDTTTQRAYRFFLSQRGVLYFSEKKYNEALKNFTRAYQLHVAASDPNQMMAALNGISKTYLAMRDYLHASLNAKQCLDLAKKKRSKHVLRMDCYEILYSAFDHFHKTDSAYFYYKLYANLKDSVLSNQIRGKLAAYIPEQKVEALTKQKELQQMQQEGERTQNRIIVAGLASISAVILLGGFGLYRSNRSKQKANRKLESALVELKATQSQLIQSEKMASLGELTAGIAHEIQNPLNFVNNFSEVNKDLLSEMKEEIENGNLEEAKSIAGTIIDNQEKINHHGKRADAIVKGMLQHSRSSSGIKESTNINTLVDECVRLAYHGLRAKDKTFNVTLETNFDEKVGSLKVIRQDIGRVILNLLNNAFYAVSAKASDYAKASSDKSATADSRYEPMVSISTEKSGDKVLISVKDNGNGIPEKVLDKIFQPFFTTKPTGQGTGLGLSLSYDIIKAHNGTIKVETIENEGTKFIVELPIG